MISDFHDLDGLAVTELRRLARRLGSQDLREALLGCLLFVLSQRRPPDAGEASRVARLERRERLASQK